MVVAKIWKKNGFGWAIECDGERSSAAEKMTKAQRKQLKDPPPCNQRRFDFINVLGFYLEPRPKTEINSSGSGSKRRGEHFPGEQDIVRA